MRSRFLDGREIAAVRARMSARDWLPFAVSLDTGLRVGDVAKIRWDDIHGREIRFIAEKTGKAGRAALSAETAAALRRFRAVAGSAWVFPSPRDPQTHITRQALWKRLKAACRRAGVAVAGFSPHSFRKVYTACGSTTRTAWARRRRGYSTATLLRQRFTLWRIG